MENTRRGSTGLAIKSGFWYVASTFLLKSVAFLTIPIFARLLSKADYGEFSNYANWQSMLLIITSFELYNSLARAYYDYKDEYDEYVSSVTVLNVLLVAGFYVLFLLNESWIFQIVNIPPQYVHILFFTLLFNSAKTLFLAKERTLYRYKRVAMISSIDTLLPTFVAVGLVVLLPDEMKLSARIYGHYLTSSLIGLVCAWILLSRGITFKLEHCVYALKLALPLLVPSLTINLLTSTNTVIAKEMSGVTLSAEVSIATSVIHILTILFTALSGAVMIWLMDNLESRSYSKIRNEVTVYLAGLVVLSMGVVLLAPEIVSILGGANYKASLPLIPGFALAAYIQAVTTIFVIILTYDKNVIATAVVSAIAAALSIVGKILLFPLLGAQSLPFVNVIICALILLANYILVYRAGYGESVAPLRYTISIVVLLVVVILSDFLYANAPIRWALVVVGLIAVSAVLIVNRKSIRSLLRNKSGS